MYEAAWVITYSWNILRLPVCVIDSQGKPQYPNTQTSYASCPVVLYPTAATDFKMLQKIRDLSEVIHLRGQPCETYLSWPISCGGPSGVDFVRMLCGWNVTDRRDLGDLVFTVALELIHFRITKAAD